MPQSIASSTDIRTPTPAEQPRLTIRKGVELNRLEAHYRAGVLTVRELGAEHGICHGRVVQLSREYGWTRDIGARARKRAAEILAHANPELPATPAQALDVATAAIVTLRKEHRKAIRDQCELVGVLVAEVEVLTSDQTLQQLVREAKRAADSGDQKRLDALQVAVERAVALSNRANLARTLIEAQKTLIGLERQAYDLDATPDDPNAGRPSPDRSMSPAEMYRWMTRQRPKKA